MKKIFTLLFCVGMFGQNFNTTNFDIDSNFSIIQNQITAEYKKRVINYGGNRYYFKKPQNALIFLFDGEKPINVQTIFSKTNYIFVVCEFFATSYLNLSKNKNFVTNGF